MTPYQENRLIVYRARIHRILKQGKRFKTNSYLYAACSILLSFFLPFYGNKHGTIIQLVGGSYFDAFIFCLVVCGSFLLIGNIVFHLQDKYRIKKLEKKIKAIKEDIAKNS